MTKDDPGKQAIIGMTGAQAILANGSKTITAMILLEKAQGEGRWEKLQQLVAEEAHAVTPVLEFQDGLLMRLYNRPKGLILEVARIEPEGVLHVLIQNRQRDSEVSRTQMFQFARSLYR